MTRYLKPEEVLYLHYRLIEETGGSHGVLNPGTLLSALARPQARFGGKGLIVVPFNQAAALFESLVVNHPFVDGNERVGIAAAALFLRRNEIVMTASNEQVVALTLGVAKGRVLAPEIAAWFRAHTEPL